jgi:uncharacterized protein
MTQRYRLTMMLISLGIILAIGRWNTGNFDFATGQFWFISGALLLILLSLVDQPYFSKDAQIFLNGTTALVSLLIVPEDQRLNLWWVFCAWALYLIIASFALMMIRSRDLFLETRVVQFISRFNRAIGRPEAIFSAFFLWGIFLQFGYPKAGVLINSLLLFWAIFLILNIPSIAQTIASLFDKEESTNVAGILTSIRSPRIAEIRLSARVPEGIVGKLVVLKLDGSSQIAEGTLFEDRIVKGFRMGRVALSGFGKKWNEVSAGQRVEIAFLDLPPPETMPVGVVGEGSSIGTLVFQVDPRTLLHAGEVVEVKTSDVDSYYQIVAAKIADDSLPDDNSSESVRVVAGQLGLWDATLASFKSIDWVAPAGQLVTVSPGIAATPPKMRCVVGCVPNSKFPVHVNIEELVTHNTALVGVTGSGKSYLAFHLIEAMVECGLKVLILDITRQHDLHLTQHNPTPLKVVGDVKTWLDSKTPIGIHQYAVDTPGYPRITADFVTAAFTEISTRTKLERGKNAPAQLCIVFEEAHSLIPEWNQVGQEGDKQQVNKTARVILQGRKFGMGSLIISQRTANVTKTILNQCNTIFAMQSFDQTGLDFLRNYMGEEYSQAISTLPVQHAILVGKSSSSARPIILKVTDFEKRWKEAPSGEQAPILVEPES